MFRSIACLAVVLTLSATLSAAAKKKPAAGAGPAATPAGTMDTNAVSMHVAAMVALYDLDLSDAQLSSLHQIAASTAEIRTRTAPKNALKIVGMLNDLHAALRKKDEDKIETLRASVKALVDDGDVELDDQPHITDAARIKAPAAVRLLNAGQIAEYLAERSEDIDDPAASMLDTLVEIRDETPKDAVEEIQTSSEQIASLVAGLDGAKAKRFADQIATWITAHQQLKAAEYTAQENALRESAKRVVGEVPAMQVLSNWVNSEIAKLLSNPHLLQAIDETRAAKKG